MEIFVKHVFHSKIMIIFMTIGMRTNRTKEDVGDGREAFDWRDGKYNGKQVPNNPNDNLHNVQMVQTVCCGVEED